MTTKSALGYSRNIPAIKMYYLAGKEEEIVKFGKNIGISSLKEGYGY